MTGKSGQRSEQTLVECLARGEKIAEAARQSGFSERTIHRRLSDDTFGQAVRNQRGKMLQNASAKLTNATDRAIDTLCELLQAQSESTRLSAARSILDMCGKYRDAVEIEERVAMLEQRISEQQKLTERYSS